MKQYSIYAWFCNLNLVSEKDLYQHVLTLFLILQLICIKLTLGIEFILPSGKRQPMWRVILACCELKKKRHRQNETGLEIAGCRHGLALWVVNMFQGELYGYAHYIQEKHMSCANVKFFWENIVCKYWKWAQKVGIPSDIKPALSVMHGKAHNWTCQVYIFSKCFIHFI